jgi:DNA-binding Lrp family transcriptional regulator
MALVFVQFRCTPGQTYEVANAIWDREVVSELYSTSGDYDLIAKVYIPEGEDTGPLPVVAAVRHSPGIQRTLTTMTFKAF